MKLKKKIALIVLTLALLLSSTVIFASAEFTEDNIEDVLEYFLAPVFVRDELENDDAVGVEKYLDYAKLTVEDGVWHIVPNDMRNANLVMKLGDEPVGSVVLSTKIMLGAPITDDDEASLELAPKFNFHIRLHKENGLWDASTFFSFDAQNEKIIYRSYNEKSGRLDKENVLSIKPAYDSWYELDFVFNFENGTYSITLVNGDDTVEIKDIPVGPFVASSEMRMLLTESRKAQAYIDYIELYEGTFVREISDEAINDIAVDYIKKLDTLSKGPLPLATRLRIAEVYRIILIEKNFRPASHTEGYDEIIKIIENDLKYINVAYKDAIVEYAANIDKKADYSDRLDYLKQLDAASSLLPTELSAFIAVPGLTEADFTLVTNAREAIEIERTDLQEIKTASDEYILKTAEYDAANKDYAYMTAFLLDLTARENVDVSYPGVKEAKETVEDALDNKLKAIVDICQKFFAKVDAMDEIISAVPETGVCGDAFEELYYGLYCDSTSEGSTVLGAHSLYNGGVLYEGLDNSTYPGLNEKITKYLSESAYIESRVAASELFITYIRLAKSATQYKVILDKVQLAAKCIDDDLTEFTVEDKYIGVAEARADYALLLEKLAKIEASAKAYVLEANKVKTALTANYNVLKSAYKSAVALKAAGDVAGMEGVKEANIILAQADALLKKYENASQSLIVATDWLDDETLSLSERRAFINAALKSKADSTDDIDGVSEAKTKLDAAIKKYNDDVNSANGQITVAMDNAMNLASTVAPTSASLTAHDIFKKIFDIAVLVNED
jgi:hypothetical protein